MFRLRKPVAQYLEQLRAKCTTLPLSYAEVGCSWGAEPPGYVVDNYRIRLGTGAIVFERARQALRDWRMLRLGWLEPCWPHAPVKEGVLVGTLARVYGLWAVNICRIVSVVDDQGPVSRFGLAYGTLAGHAERGEERFLIEWLRADDSVWYDIRAVSRPGTWMTRLAYPVARRLQRRFGHDSLAALLPAVE